MIYHAVYYFDSVDELKQSSIMFSNQLRGHVVVAHLDADGSVHAHVVLDVPERITFPSKYINIGSKSATVCVLFSGYVCDLFKYLLNDFVIGPITITGSLTKYYKDYMRQKK